MKKTYIAPEALVISLSMTLPLATSTDIGDTPVDPGTYDVKESYKGGGKTIWDEEW